MCKKDWLRTIYLHKCRHWNSGGDERLGRILQSGKQKENTQNGESQMVMKNLITSNIGVSETKTMEIGAKSSDEWWRLVKEAAKMILHVSPTVELSAAALSDIDWTLNLLKNCGSYLKWVSLHGYWDMVPEKNELANYTQCMAYTDQVDRAVKDVRGLLTALHLEKNY